MFHFVILDKRMVYIEIWNNLFCHPKCELPKKSLCVLVKGTTTASAVNEITVTNAATTNGPTISATGSV
jgi:hypothetical protein